MTNTVSTRLRRTMRGSCSCWRARRKKASWRPSWLVSSSGSGRTEACKPASAARASISSTTRQHSESPAERTDKQLHNCETHSSRESLENSVVFDVKSLPSKHKQTESVVASSQSQAAQTFSCVQGKVQLLCGLLDCQYLPSSTERGFETLFNLWPHSSVDLPHTLKVEKDHTKIYF